MCGEECCSLREGIVKRKSNGFNEWSNEMFGESLLFCMVNFFQRSKQIRPVGSRR